MGGVRVSGRGAQEAPAQMFTASRYAWTGGGNRSVRSPGHRSSRTGVPHVKKGAKIYRNATENALADQAIEQAFEDVVIPPDAPLFVCP